MKFPLFSQRRPAHTLLYITEAKTFCVDFDNAGVMTGNADTVEADCPTPAKLADCIGRIAARGRPLGRKIWLLYVRLPIAVLTLPTIQLAGIDEPGLIQALQFELEGLTGQSLIDMQLAYHALGDRDELSTYWVSLINRLQFEDIRKAVKKAGSGLGGLLHPAGLPLALANPENRDWLRIECWPNQLMAVRSSSENGMSMQLISFDNRHWRTHLEQWLAGQGPVRQSETLLGNTIEVLPETAYSLHLVDDDAVSRWLALWAGVLVKKAPPVPALRYQSSLNKDLLLMASGGAAALLICSSHLVWHLYQANQFAYQYEALKNIETSMAALQKTLKDDRGRYDKLKLKLDKLKGDSDTLPKMIQALQQRPARLLEALARGRPENLLVEEIGSEGDTVKISGISLDSFSANELTSYLEENLAGFGWEIIAPTKKNMQLFDGGGPWEFAIAIRDKGIDGFTGKKHD